MLFLISAVLDGCFRGKYADFGRSIQPAIGARSKYSLLTRRVVQHSLIGLAPNWLMSRDCHPGISQIRMDLGKHLAVFQSKMINKLGLHGLGQPGAACSSQDQLGATLRQEMASVETRRMS